MRREYKDAEYLKSSPDLGMLASKESLTRKNNTWAGTNIFKKEDFIPYGDQTAAFIVCSRFDLQHPLNFPDNLFCDCNDCGCNLQYTVSLPKGTRVCLCCAAIRVRKLLRGERIKRDGNQLSERQEASVQASTSS